MGSPWTRAQTCVPCIGRWVLNHCATMEALRVDLKSSHHKKNIWGRPSRWRRSRRWRSPSSPQIHQKYIYMWNNSYRTPTECWQKTSDFPKGKKLPHVPGHVADRVLVLRPGVRPVPLRWESGVQDIGPPENSQLSIISNSERSPRDLHLNAKTQLHSMTSKLQCWTP